jgi:hypothetical protein
MSQYRKKPVVIEATQWFKHGDHSAVVVPSGVINQSEFGLVRTLEGWHVVTPGDWIITGIKGEHYPCKQDIFAATYEPVTQAAPDQEGRCAPVPNCPHCRGTGVDGDCDPDGLVADIDCSCTFMRSSNTSATQGAPVDALPEKKYFRDGKVVDHATARLGSEKS